MSQEQRTSGQRTRIQLSEVIATLALSVSLATFIYQVWRSHRLEGTVIHVEPDGTVLSAQIMLRNYGDYPETFRRAKFIFEKDLLGCEGVLPDQSVGPAVLKPGEVVVNTLTADVTNLLKHGALPKTGTTHVGVSFQAISADGSIREAIYRFTELEFRDGQVVSSAPDAADKVSFINLLAGQCANRSGY